MRFALKVFTVPLIEVQTAADVTEGDSNPLEAVGKVGSGIKGVASGAIGVVARGINKTAAKVVQVTSSDQQVQVAQEGDTLVISIPE